MEKTTRLNVLLIDDQPERADALTEALQGLGHRVIARLPDTLQLSKEVALLSPDIVIIDAESPDRDVLDSLSAVSRNTPRPVIYFAESESHTNTISDAIHAGVSAYIADGMSPMMVKSVLQTAIGHFNAFQTLRGELEQTRVQLADRKIIDKAKGMLIAHQGCSEDQAYKTLRKLAMDRSQKLADVANDVIQVLQTQENSRDKRTRS